MASNGKQRHIAGLREADVTRAIFRAFHEHLEAVVESDVVVIGAGPAGLVCARDLAQAGHRVVLVEQMAHPGGGFWSGGYLMTRAAIAAPAQELLEALGVPCEPRGEDLYIVEAPLACAKLIASTLEAGVRYLNLTRVVDLIVRGAPPRVEGVVVNWWPVEEAGHDIVHVDPVALESRVVVDATGHDAVAVGHLARRGLHQPVPGNGPMWVSVSEEEVVARTGEVFPGLYVVGLAVAAAYGLPRMGPAFGSMLLSGARGAALIHQRLTASRESPAWSSATDPARR